jgi:hypothetical protein
MVPQYRLFHCQHYHHQMVSSIAYCHYCFQNYCQSPTFLWLHCMWPVA